MKNLEANIVRSFAEVRKDISDLQDQIKEIKQLFFKKYTKTKSKKKRK